MAIKGTTKEIQDEGSCIVDRSVIEEKPVKSVISQKEDKISIVDRELSSLKKLSNNPRTIKSEDMNRLVSSIKKFGVIEGRPFLLSNRTGELVIIGGNQRYEACKQLGIEYVPTYLFEGLTEQEEREIIIRDNISNGEWDYELLVNDWETGDLKEWGLEINFDTTEEEEKEDKENPYTDNVNVPIYEPNNLKPSLEETYEREKYFDLIKKIELSTLDNEKKEFLKICATRFISFNYKKIADYYAHSEIEMQNIMEDLALVIVDFNKAIENGLVKMTKDIEEINSNLKDNE